MTILEQIEQITGIGKETQLNILKEVQENNDKLESCTYHDFSIEIHKPFRYFSNWRCKNCGGEVGDKEKKWYELGISA